MSKARDRSLQEAMRARRAAKPLLTVEELRQREAERERIAVESEAATLVEAWRQTGAPVDSGGALATALYRAIFARDRDAYYGSRHWERRARAQLTATPQCEVERCGGRVELHVQHLGLESLVEEQVGVGLITLCDGCLRRAERRRRDLARPLRRTELVKLDPLRPLYDAAAIAALKRRYARPLRRSDLPR